MLFSSSNAPTPEWGYYKVDSDRPSFDIQIMNFISVFTFILGGIAL